MGLFDRLFRRTPQWPLQVWLDEGARRRGMARAVQQDLAAGRHALVVAHFADELVACGQALAAAGVAFDTLTRWDDAATRGLAGPARAVAILARALPVQPAAATVAGPPRASVRLAELHPLAEANARVLAFAQALPFAALPMACASLESPHLATFASPRLRGTMTALGMTADEPIGNPLVARAVQQALAKLAARATGDRAADSITDWLARNVRRDG